MTSAYNISLSLLGRTPAQFWRDTPAETANMLAAFKVRENRKRMQSAWVLYHHMKLHASETAELSVMGLFEGMPGAFPEEIPAHVRESSRNPGMTPEQRSEAERRKKKKRVQR